MKTASDCETCVRRLQQDVGLRLALEAATLKWFPTSNSSREAGSPLQLNKPSKQPCAKSAAGKAAGRMSTLMRLQQAVASVWCKALPKAADVLQSGCCLQVRDRLLAACAAAGVRVRYGAGLADLRADHDAGGGWRCALQDGSSFHASRVVGCRPTGLLHAGTANDRTRVAFVLLGSVVAFPRARTCLCTPIMSMSCITSN